MGATISLPMSTAGATPSPIITNAIRAILEDLSKEPVKPKDLSGVVGSRYAITGSIGNTNNNVVASSLNLSTDAIKSKARVKLGIDIVHHINYAFVGRPGVGKSSLINALRLVHDEGSGAAKVGEVETTNVIQKYTHPNFPHIILWDLPGAGTLRQPGTTYYEDNMLYAFDCVLILSSDRFDAFDYEIAYKAVTNKTEFAFVRTKADISITAIARATKKTMDEASREFKKMVHQSFLAGLKASPYYSFFQSSHVFHLFILSAWAFGEERKPYHYYDPNKGVHIPSYWYNSSYYHEDIYEKKLDKSLTKMDEEEFLHYITQAVSSRVNHSTANPQPAA